MKEVITITKTWCDHPACVATRQPGDDSQETQSAEVWFYVSGKGRKTNSIKVELCAQHVQEMRSLFNSLQKFDQKGASA